MHYLERLFIKRKNVRFLRGLDRDLGVELLEIEKLWRDHSIKLRLIRRFMVDLNKDRLKDLDAVMKRVKKLLAKDRRGETKLEKIFWNITTLFESISRRGDLDQRETKDLLEIRRNFIGQKGFVTSLVEILQKQVEFFNSARKKFVTNKQLIREFLELVSEEGELFGHKGGIERQVKLAEDLAVELEQYESISKTEFPDIVSENIRFWIMSGTLYYKKNVKPRAGIVLVHGFKRTRFVMELLAKRLASLGYLAYSFDLPGHAESGGTFGYGLISDFIIEGVKLLRSRGVRKVAVVGMSVGAVGTTFASFGYSQKLEYEIYHLYDKYLRTLRQISDEGASTTRLKKILDEIEELIVGAIRKSVAGNARIDAIVLASPPATMQVVMPPSAIRFIAHTPSMHGMFRNLKKGTIPKVGRYLAFVKNVRSYLDLVNYFSETSSFIRRYRDLIMFKTPKLLMYGTRDVLLRTFWPWRGKHLTETYMATGNCRFVYFPLGHSLTGGGSKINKRSMLSSEKVGKLIAEFLEKTL